MGRLSLDPSRQIIAAQCSGALILAKLGLLANVPVCTDSKTRPWIEGDGGSVLDQPFVAHGNIATAGGCLASQFLAACVISRLVSWAAAEKVIRYVAPVGHAQEHVDRALVAIGRYLPELRRSVERAARAATGNLTSLT